MRYTLDYICIRNLTKTLSLMITHGHHKMKWHALISSQKPKYTLNGFRKIYRNLTTRSNYNSIDLFDLATTNNRINTSNSDNNTLYSIEEDQEFSRFIINNKELFNNDNYY